MPTPPIPPESPRADQPLAHPLRVAALAARKPTRFDLKPDAETRTRIAQLLDITAVPELRFKGELLPRGRSDWELTAMLTALVEQPCSVTLAPVLTRIAEQVQRRYLADLPEPEADEMEIPDDDGQEPLPEIIDPGAVALEALALALPLYPRATTGALGEAVFAGPGIAPLRDEDLRPFSGLASLAQKLGSGEKDGK